VQVLLESTAQNRNVTWELITEAEPCQVRVSTDQIKQVFINIATNAIDAMQPDGGKLTIRLSQEAGQQQVHLVFQDTGPGIPPENISQLFEPFFTTKASGLGLGLAISYEIVEQMGGHVEVESLPGQGATFHVWLPQACSDG
jgi:signal transduction histidine kinase